MTRTNDAEAEPAPHLNTASSPSRTPAPRVLVVDADCALSGLLAEWLGSEGCEVVQAAGDDAGAAERFDLVIIDVPYPRQGGVDLIARITKHHPMTPILAMSSTFFGRIECCGPVARALGVACVLPTPLSRQALVDAPRRFLPR